MGRVFCAVDTRLQRTVAVKILPPEQASDEETLLRFQNEAQSAARLDHENIARVYHVGEDQGLHYIVFEFVAGVNIRTLVEQKGPLPLAEAVSYTLQVAEALAHADARNVVHRDIKPSNLLITPEGQIKLIDMGLARLKRLGTSAADLTASGVTLGTFDYIAPEQARDPRSADVRSDIYSLGCTFFYMLAGRPPFPEGTVLQKLLQHQGDQPPDVRQFRPDLPDEAARVLRKMLAKDPRHRYRDSAELVEELMSLAYQIGLRPATRVGRTLGRPRGWAAAILQRHLPWLAPIAALICIVLVLDFFPRQSDPAPPPWPEPPPAARGDSRQTPTVEPGKQPPQLPGTGRPVPPQETGEPPSQASGGPSGAPTAEHPPAKPESPSPGELAGPPKLESTDHMPPEVAGSGTLQFDPLESKLTLAEEPPPLVSLVSGDEAASGGLSGATGPAAEPSSVSPAPGPAPSRAGLLVVSDRAQGENEFPTLQAACRAAVSGDVIELRYNGRREEQPITLANLRLTIRAGKEYQPVVVFRPDQVDPVKYPRSMLIVTAGRLTLVNLALELQVPRQVPAENWCLFEIRGGQTVRLDKCSLSVCNASDQLAAYHPDVAFFRSKAVPGAGLVAGEQSLAAIPPATIDLVDCIARGEAVFLCAADLQPVHLIWENGLLVTSEELLWACGSQEVPQPGEMLQIDLRHLTAVVHGGFCRMTQTVAAPHQLDTQIYCADSILMAAPGAPLIEQEGVNNLEDLRQQIAWNGDRNFYENFDVFWSVRNLDQETLCKPMTFMDWQSYWGSEEESLPLANSVIWKKLPDASRALHTHVPADYAVADATEVRPNPARDAGLQAERLPRQPPPLGAEEPQGPPLGKEEPQRPEVAPD
jgi:serine/threonine-protein kinase